jgi:hypothetical protein
MICGGREEWKSLRLEGGVSMNCGSSSKVGKEGFVKSSGDARLRTYGVKEPSL